HFIALKEITRYRFYQLTGLSNGFLDKRGSISSDNCQKICNTFPDLNPEWLLMGTGEVLKSDQCRPL
ncbi:MAG: hypothetical protein LWW91_12395, partial [Bacteroidales bacterium]|nr:hypothetical protein [Bacteroidales bacterium]